MEKDTYTQLVTKIADKKARVGLVGIGYVGLALGEGAANKGFIVIGYGRRSEKVAEVNELHIPNFTATTNLEALKEADIVAICVPTPVNEDLSPDFGPVIDASEKVAKILRPGQLIIVESSISPGTTRNLVLPILQKSGLVAEKDFFLAHSPERIDPGNEKYPFSNIPKVVAGLSPLSTELTRLFYQPIVPFVSIVSSLETAELTKMFENTYRFVNIGLVNEMTNYTEALGIDMWEVIRAASTKPFGFMPHYPGPGIGGHCIPVDPHYIREDAKKRGIKLRLIEAATTINQNQPKKVVSHALSLLNSNGHKAPHEVLLLGITYKPDVPDLRESPAITIWELFKKKGVRVNYHDPHIPEYNGSKSIQLSLEAIKKNHMVVLITNHSSIDYPLLLSYNIPILDTRNVFAGINNSHIYRL